MDGRGGTAFFCVCDGHGGDGVAHFCAKNLVCGFLRCFSMALCTPTGLNVCSYCYTPAYGSIAQNLHSASIGDGLQAVSNAVTKQNKCSPL